MRLRLPSRTVRLRLTLLYGGLFTMSGAILLAITYLLVWWATGHFQITTAPSTQGGSLGTLGTPPAQPAASVVSQLHHTYLRQLLTVSGIALAAMAVASMWLGWIVAGRVLRPLRTMTASTRRISQENLHERLALRGTRDELTDLGNTIDGLLARLETAFEAQRRFVANASHELRTPLAMMRTSLDVAEGKPPPVPREVSALAGKLREGLDQADRLIESFLVLARAQQGIPAELTTVALTSVVRAAIEARERDAARLGVRLHSGLDAVDVIGDRTLLRRLVDNLLDNALRYNHSGGAVRIACGTTDDDTARLVVENTGPPLDDADACQLGQPFRRPATDRTADRTTTGSVGLGLSIVEAIAAAHDGTVQITARPDGGLRIAVELPYPPHAPAPLAPR